MSDQKQTKENETMNAAQVLVRCLENEGVEYVFGIPGEENLEVMRALKDSKIKFTGWAYLPDSPLRDLMVEVFTDQYGYEPKVEAIHAGLECGLFSAKLPGLDCVSFGPDLKEIHTFREKMSISSVQRVWKMLVELLRRMKP